MGWFGDFEFSNISTATLLLLGAPLVAGLVYKLRQYYLQSNTYEGIADNETLRAKMEAARLKQQDKYSQFIQEHGEELKKKNEELEKELKVSSSEDRKKGSRSDSDGSSLFDRDYMPLMSGGSGSTYRPAKKRPCGPCGGGGCG